MDSKYFGLNEAIGKLVKVPADQMRIVSIAAALAVSTLAQLPSSSVENPPVYFAEQVVGYAAETLSAMNESVMFSAKSALDYTQLFWKMRYCAAFPTQMLVDNAYQIDRLLSARPTQTIDITSLWSGGLMHLSDELAQFMNRYRLEIMGLAARMTAILAPVPLDTATEPSVG